MNNRLSVLTFCCELCCTGAARHNFDNFIRGACTFALALALGGTGGVAPALGFTVGVGGEPGGVVGTAVRFFFGIAFASGSVLVSLLEDAEGTKSSDVLGLAAAGGTFGVGVGTRGGGGRGV